jgi:tRNA (guanine37-N1)-methyltransferase
MNFHIITLFPEMFDSYLGESILARAQKEKKIKVELVNPRKFVSGKYKKVWPDGNVSLQIDERPYGGGPGMVMMAEPVLKAVESVIGSISKRFSKSSDLLARKQKGSARLQKSFEILPPKIKIINFSPSGEKFDTSYAKKITQVSKKGGYTDIILICGRYEGIDSRVDIILKKEYKKDFEQISIGDYVLTGGELPAMILIDCISRQIPGVLGNFDSREEERVSSSEIYTRPEVLEWPIVKSGTAPKKPKKYSVPAVLLSGDHKKIEEWKKDRK